MRRTADERADLVAGIEPDLRRLCQKWAGVLGPSHHDDAFQIAWLAAWGCAATFDPARGTRRFFNWAFPRVRWALSEYVRKELTARFRGVPWPRLEHLHERATRADGGRPDHDLERLEVCAWVRWAVSELGYAERGVVEMRYGLGDRHEYTQDECGRVFGVTGQRAYQREQDALNHLRDLLETFVE